MFRKLATLATTALACLTLASCVSEGGGRYSTYDRSYYRYDGPAHVYRDDRRYREWDRHRDYRRDARRDDRRNWDRNDRRRSDDRDRRDYRGNNREGNAPIILPPRR